MQNIQLYKKIAVLFTGCIFLFSCENDMEEVAALNKKKIQVDEGKNISSYMSQGGKMKAHLTARLMLNYRTD